MPETLETTKGDEPVLLFLQMVDGPEAPPAAFEVNQGSAVLEVPLFWTSTKKDHELGEVFERFAARVADEADEFDD
jgi:hypothetical protein